MDKEAKRKRLVGTISFFVAFLAVSLAFKFFSDDAYDEIKKVSDEMNRKTPVEADPYSRLDSTSVIKEPLTVQYHFTAKDIELPANEDINALKAHMQRSCQADLDTMKAMAPFRKNNVAMRYIYKDVKGKHIFDFTVKPQKRK
jgi:hypothetical protein